MGSKRLFRFQRPRLRPIVGVAIAAAGLAVCAGGTVEAWQLHYLLGLTVAMVSLVLIYAALMLMERGGRTR